MKRYPIFSAFFIMIFLTLFSSCYECQDNVDIESFYAEENPLPPNSVTKLHIILDHPYGPLVLSTEGGYQGFMPDYPDSEISYSTIGFSGDEERQSDHYTIYFRAPVEYGKKVNLSVCDPYEHCVGRSKDLTMRTID